MSAKHSMYGPRGYSALDWDNTRYGLWETHRNWRGWFGWDLRRWITDAAFHYGHGWWQYGRSKRVAREMLHSVYADPRGPSVSIGKPGEWQIIGGMPRQWTGKRWR